MASRLKEFIFHDESSLLETSPERKRDVPEVARFLSGVQFAIRSYVDNVSYIAKRSEKFTDILSHYSEAVSSHPKHLVLYREWLADLEVNPRDPDLNP